MPSLAAQVTAQVAVQVAAAAPTSAKMQVLYGACQPHDIARHVALYWLYRETHEGRQGFTDLTKQLGLTPSACAQLFSRHVMATLLSFSTPYSPRQAPELSLEDCAHIRAAAAHLPHRAKKGMEVENREALCALPEGEISLARGVLLSTEEDNPQLPQRIARYEAQLDLMALYVLAQISIDAPAREKMRALQRFIFETMRVTFPPHSRYEKEIIRYTHLPGIMEERKGVCLGVSVLYGALAERLGIPVTFVTPPGHIFVRYQDLLGERNIETTLRGVHIDSKEYATITLSQLPTRSVKEVIGLVHMNTAAGYLQSGDYTQALKHYTKAWDFLPNDADLAEFTGYALLLLERGDEACTYWQIARKGKGSYALGENYLLRDLERGHAGAPCILALMESCGESLKEREEKCQQIADLLKRYPKWYTGQLAMAQLLMALHRKQEARVFLDRCVSQEPSDLQAALLSVHLSIDRYDWTAAWHHLHRLEKELKRLSHEVEEVVELRRKLIQVCAEPNMKT